MNSYTDMKSKQPSPHLTSRAGTPRNAHNALPIEDNRHEAAQLAAMQALVDHSPRSQSLKTMQAMMAESPRIRGQGERMQALSGSDGIGFGARQMKSARLPQRPDVRYPVQAVPQSHAAVTQCVMTRSMVDEFVEYVRQYSDWPPEYQKLSEYDQYLVKGRVESALGINLDSDNFGVKNFGAEENSDVDHPESGDAIEFGPDTSEYKKIQLKAYALQFKRGPGRSDLKSFNPIHGSAYSQVGYERDAVGNIDFSSPYAQTKWHDPREGAQVDLAEDSKNPEYGKTLSNTFVHIPSASRQQHFSIANRVAKKNGGTYGNGGNSPDGWTWHHLLSKYKMVLVDYKVHQQFGHNGGFYFW